ncbi:MAG: 16S rRNA (uracil1498-N3)-methyltransferase [Candidatus Azotimanducaceae bacterium]|jgi:16S rRNA (uracil1498-N3)-methyltransferase
MRYSRFYTDQNISVDKPLCITGPRAHYMRNVLRLSRGDKLCLFNGSGGEFDAIINNLSKHEVLLDVLSFNDINRQSTVYIELGLALIKRDAMDTAIQKATELGVSKIQPLLCHNSTISTKGVEKRLAHWQEVSINACEQCGLNMPPEILTPVETTQWFDNDADLKLLAAPNSNTSLDELESNPKHISIAIGPEGGFNSDEIQCANKHGFVEIFLGTRILRADTAVISMMALAQSHWGDM